MPGKEIGQHFFVRMSQVGRAVHVINRRGEKIGSGHDVTLLIDAFLANSLMRRTADNENALAAGVAG
jgi:hypothetical protein